MLKIPGKRFRNCLVTLVIGAALITINPGEYWCGHYALALGTPLNLLTKNAYPGSGYSYIVNQEFGTATDTGTATTRSKLRIFENGRELGPPHSMHADIRNMGMGRFSHWGGNTGTGASQLYFSASDNTDPRTNGRMYTYRIDSQVPTPPVHPTVTATLLAQAGEDFVSTRVESPDGLQDVHIKLTGVSGTIRGVRITGLDGIWEAPANAQGNWIVAIRPQSDPSVVDLYLDFWKPVTSYHLTVTFSDGATQMLQTVSAPAPPTPPSHPTVTATLLAQTGEDFVSTRVESPDGLQDVHIKLTGVSGTIRGVRITGLDGIWEAPANAQGNWIVAIRPQSDPSVVDLYLDFWKPVTSYHLTVTFSDGATQTLQTVSAPTPPPSSITLKTDIGIYSEPPLPAMGPAGSKIVDPTFGTTILRVTDPTTGGNDCMTPYSYYPVFNKTSTRLYVQCGNSAVFYSFDPVTMAISNKRVAPSSGVQWYGAVWSGVNPDIIYGNSTTELLAYNVATNTYTTLRNFSAEIADKNAAYLIQMSMSRDDDVFAFSYGKSGSSNFGYVVWKRTTNTLLLNKLDDLADEVHVDKTGRYLHEAVQPAGTPRIFDLETGVMAQLGSYEGEGYVHMDTGTGTIFAGDGTMGGLSYRSMATPHTITHILPGLFRFANLNYSMNADNEKWALVWVQRDDSLSNTRPFENEIIQVATDGSGRLRRIVHHRSKWNDYYDQPNANISRNGQFVAFTSNWGNASGRRDVYIVQIPPAPMN